MCYIYCCRDISRRNGVEYGFASNQFCSRRQRQFFLIFLCMLAAAFDRTSHVFSGMKAEACGEKRPFPTNMQSFLSNRSHQQGFFWMTRGGANRFVSDNENKNEKHESHFEKRGGRRTSVMGAKKNARRNKHSPVVYQYFGKSRSRGGNYLNRSDSDDASMNFILFGPNVDHWKTVGETLASMGFNVMACERITDKERDGSPNADDENLNLGDHDEDAPELVLDILDALKWNRAVILGCDDESLLAMETAVLLAPERIAGLILSGDLAEANRFAMEAGGAPVLDSFLSRVLDCPFLIVWDGGLRKIVSGHSAHDAIERSSSPFAADSLDGRCVILGGGSAPHRTKPEYFAWVLARFVEEKLEHHPRSYDTSTRKQGLPSSLKPKSEMKVGETRRIIRSLNLPFGIDSVVSPEGRLLLGRAIAAAIIYTSCMKVIFVQYGVLKAGLISVKNSVDSVHALRRKIFQVLGAFIINFGYIPRFFKLSLKKTEEVCEDNDQGGNEKQPIVNKKEDTKSSVPSSDEFKEGNTNYLQKEVEDGIENSEDGLRIKPLFFLDNIFT